LSLPIGSSNKKQQQQQLIKDSATRRESFETFGNPVDQRNRIVKPLQCVMAAAPPPAITGGPVPQAAPLTSFQQRYLDQTYGNDGGNMVDLMAFFDPQAAPARDPMTLRNAVVNESGTTSHAYLILQQDPATPNNLGQITMFHGVKMYPTSVGAGAGQWQGQSFAFVHNVLDQNDPQTIRFPLDAFHCATGTGAMQCLVPQALQLALNANPALEALNPPGALNADTH
jgi:hypothetical protein